MRGMIPPPKKLRNYIDNVFNQAYMKKLRYIFLSLMAMSFWALAANAQMPVDFEPGFSISVTRAVRLGQKGMITGTLSWNGFDSGLFAVNPLKTRVIDSDGELYDFRDLTMEIGNSVVMDKSQFNTKPFELPGGVPVKFKIVINDFNKYTDVIKILEVGYFGSKDSGLPEGKLSQRDLQIE